MRTVVQYGDDIAFIIIILMKKVKVGMSKLCFLVFGNIGVGTREERHKSLIVIHDT